jgi:hypothetical protein
MLEMSIGTRGDPHRSLELSRRAVALAGRSASTTTSVWGVYATSAARTTARAAQRGPRRPAAACPECSIPMPTDPLDRSAARRLLDEPDDACGYSRDAWNDGGQPLAHRDQ